MALAVGLLGASGAAAATRYAAPGGTGIDPCASPAAPCSVYTAADGGAPSTTLQSGDVVELAPGTYTDADLGPGHFINPTAGVTVRGEPGEARPVIVLDPNEGFWGAFFLSSGTTASHIEIRNEASSGSAVAVLGGTVDGVIARSTSSSAFTCAVFEGTVRGSACLNDAGGTAMGASVGTFAGTHATTIRNSTAIATGGGGSVGADFGYFASEPGTIATIDAKGLIVRGEKKDIIARGLEFGGAGKGASTTFTLDHSDYATVETFASGTGGAATVTAAGTNENITAAPLLAADGLHQLPGSPTVDTGAVDGKSPALDVDDQLRTIGAAPDIGADELVNPTSTAVSCTPSSLVLGGSPATSNCLVTVSDAAAAAAPPSGNVALSASGGGLGGCTLVAAGGASATCSATYTPGPAGSQTVTAVYGGDGSHGGSEGSTTIEVTEPPTTIKSGGRGKANKAPETQLKKHPRKRTTKRKARFTFISSEAGSSFECRLDRKPYRTCASPFKKKVKLGSHQFKVRAVDSKGKADATPAVFRWRVIAP